MSTDPLDIPDFLRVENRKPPTAEEQARVDAVFAKVPPPRDFLRRSPEDQAAADRIAEEVRQKSIGAMKNRFARGKKQKPPAGAVWDIRTSRWVMPGDTPPSVSQLAREAAGSTASKTTRQIMEEIRGQRKMTTKPEFGSMTGAQLLAAYNELSVTKRKAKFSDRSQGVSACERAWTAKHGAAPAPAAKAAEDKEKNVAKAAKDLRARANGPDEGTRSKRLLMKIKLLAAKNPRREGTDAHRHFEAMRGGVTVGAYLEKFKPADRRTAAQWLSNTVRDGHAKVE